MKFAFMTFSTPELSLADVLAAVKKYGYDGVEPRMDAKHAHGIEVDASAQQRDAIRKQADQAGVPLVCLATSLRYSDPETNSQMVEDTHPRIDLAGDLGIPAMRVFGGSIPEGVSREQAADLLVSGLSAVADHAAERGVTLCFETHDSWCDPAEVAKVLTRVNKPSICANWDIMHPVRGGFATIDESYETLKPWVRHLHIHDGITQDGNLSLAPIGTGQIDHRRALERLMADGYDGYISGEWIGWEPYDIHLPRELATMRQYEAEIGG